MDILELITTTAAVAGVIVAIHFGRKGTKKAPTKTKKIQQNLETRYQKQALETCDIIDLANLPEDRHIVTRELELRRLYVALRMRVEIRASDEPDDKTLAALEERRNRGWGDTGQPRDDQENRVSLGERLQSARRLVVLGDPGAGKSTLLRWLATAYLLRLEKAPDFRDLPDSDSLPDSGWLPILVRCRDLSPEAHTLDEMLLHTLKKLEFPEDQYRSLGLLLRERLENGTAILLVDGLDEISPASARARLARQLEQIHKALPKAPMIVTSRIVGYREMGHRIGAGFEHLTVADLSEDDKDAFARRWCQLTERPERQEAAAAELIRDIHSANRIERLTGNPMLLTTMALIKRKIGRLPQRRVKLYEEAVKVLLDWRSEVDAPLDDREALPQLEYLAHAMCAEGIQRIHEDQVLELLGEARDKYPNIHAMTQHGPEEFLTLLEQRTGLLIQSGHTDHHGRGVPVYEFRHLTFQEYLAGMALLQGHYRGWEKGRTLAEAMAPLAGQVKEERSRGETIVVENWREALRLAVAACNDNEVEEVLAAILKPPSSRRGMPGPGARDGENEQPSTVRPRAVLATLCLADEPDVSEALAREIVGTLAEQVGGNDSLSLNHTSLNAAALELGHSRWAGLLDESLLEEFWRRDAGWRWDPGRLYGLVRATQVPTEAGEFSRWIEEQAARLADCHEREAAGIALTVWWLAIQDRDCRVLADALTQRLIGHAPLSQAAAWALFWMNRERHEARVWHPDAQQQERLLAAAARPACDSETLRWLSGIFGQERMTRAVDILLARLPTSPPATRAAIAEALGEIGAPRALDALLTRLRDREEDHEVRAQAAIGLGKIGDPRALDALLTRLQDREENDWVREKAAIGLGKIGGARAVAGLRAFLDHPDEGTRRAALGGLAHTREDGMDRRLLSEDLYGFGPWLDPQAPIDEARIAEAAEKLREPAEEIRRRYRALAERFGLRLAG
uniref:PBS lyase HEAT-like repeat-containing protein n=1 Tax=Candidatus Kentrum sp. FW TaxID=2126338 RepID=A0A450RYL3_9GAMM|nr:MAG: PBS lyase HEAT-like repeat-containing protein [Candidatus Kentron sp. FW]